MRAAFMFCFVAAVSSPAISANWQQFGTDGDGTPWSLDISSVIRNGGLAQVWVKGEYAASKQGVKSTKHLWRFRCASHEAATLSWVDYDVSGLVVQEGSPEAHYEPVVPETLGETALKLVCHR